MVYWRTALLFAAIAAALGCGRGSGSEDELLASAVARVTPTDSHFKEDRNRISNAGKKATPLLVGALKDARNPARVWAISSLLAQVDPETGAPAVIKLLDSRDPLVRLAALQASLEFGPDPRLEAAILRRAGDFDARVREAALIALGGMPSPEAKQTLVASLGRAGREAFAAALGLARSKDKRALPVLRRAMREGSTADRRQAISSIGLYGDDVAVKELTPLRSDPDPEVRRMVGFFLRSQTPK